ncbi:interferon-stimulated 20 kDa exonuclease-like 2 isoform X2 [Cyclopterus lumpus]|uniref:interferon-stimulated 20 kDa exonuclease-like 2 isoform X2 n=1 Tax=Cyclopterus lumpus TaxID=8103 RepID=UPI001487321C|nr:interferon-stimulated 20 kDa exonuclease-like 2 isoform X2 [Cyclopterus lumpus]
MSADTNGTTEDGDRVEEVSERNSAPPAFEETTVDPNTSVTMSNFWLNLCYSDDSARRRPPRGNRGRYKGFQHRAHPLEQRGFPEGRDLIHHRHDPHLRQNGGFTHYAGSPHPRGAASASPSAASTSTHQLPSCSATNRGCHGRPASRKPPPAAAAASSAPSAHRPSPACSHKPAAAVAAHRPSPSCSHKPAAAQTSAGIPTKYLALDCEMVGTGPKGSISQLARCSLVSYEGDVVYDKFINPSMPVTDYRTRWSGIRRCDLVNAMPYVEARKEILRLLMGKVVIGHAVHNDFKVLGYSHPAALTRDTSRIPLLNLRAGFAVAECASLKRLTKAILNRDIQVNAARC